MTEEATHSAIDFSQQYILLRNKEGRIYSDKEIADLPEIDKGHQHYHEWRIRKDTSDRLIKYLINKKKALEILEVGCGNGQSVVGLREWDLPPIRHKGPMWRSSSWRRRRRSPRSTCRSIRPTCCGMPQHGHQGEVT